MILNNVRLFGIKITAVNKDIILEYIQKRLQQFPKKPNKKETAKGEVFTIFTPNPEMIIQFGKDTFYKNIVNTAFINLPDGWGIIWASKILSKPVNKRIGGIDFMLDLVNLAAKYTMNIGLIGGRGQVAVKTLECLQKKHPNIKGWTYADNLLFQVPKLKRGEYDVQIERIVDLVKKNNTRMVFVGLGMPKQEYLINLLKTKLEKEEVSCLLMAVGGAFNYISGTIPRAPRLLQNCGLEWLFRLIMQPWRARRQIALLQFVFLVIREKLDPVTSKF